MTGIPFRTTGRIYSSGERTALLLAEGGEQQTLRLAYLIRGTEETFFPESVLDDWGHEISGSELYHWVKENATYFPRAELFGYNLRGQSEQYFLRELDLVSRYVPFCYQGPNAPIDSGVQLHAILLIHNAAIQQKLLAAPESISFPLREAAVEWWLVKDSSYEDDDRDYSRILDNEEAA